MPYPMIDALAGHLVMQDGKLLAAAAPEAGDCYVPTDERMYYEVVRIVQGVPLFLEDHLERLSRSVGQAFALPDSLAGESRQLIDANGIAEANLRMVVTATRRVLHLTPSYYPDRHQVEQGVPTGILAWERENPNTKIIHPAYKAAVAERFARPGPFGPCFELLLADRQGRLTEGSRSNLFFLRGSTVLSAPDDCILLGITRRYVMSAIAAAGLDLSIGLLTLDEIRTGQVDGAFLSGSPIDLLPVSAIEDLALPSAACPSFRSLREAYMAIVQTYIDSHRHAYSLTGKPPTGYTGGSKAGP